MSLEAQWETLERRLPDDRSGQMMQRIHPHASVDLFIAAQRRDPHRTMELRVGAAASPTDLPDGTRGIALAAHPVPTEPGRTALTLELREAAGTALFATVCTDIADVLRRCEDEEHAVAGLLNRFLRWTRLLQRAPEGLSPQRQRGLYGELWSLRDVLAPAIGLPAAIAAWTGPDDAPRDFEHHGAGVETKVSAANEPQVVVINGERQLDDAGLRSLHLVHLSLEMLHGSGETLPDIVHAVRGLAAGGPVEDLLEDLLLASGYSDAHASRYQHDGYTLRRLSIMRVAGDFPRLTEDRLPDGVGSVRYRLAIDACRDHEVQPSMLTAALKEGTDAPH